MMRLQALRSNIFKLGISRIITRLIVISTAVYVTLEHYALYPVGFLDSGQVVQNHIPVGRGVRNSTNYCDNLPPSLNGKIYINIHNGAPTLSDTENLNPMVLAGGSWAPSHCTPRQKVAIIIPYRDRMTHLRYLLHYLHPFLRRQERDYRIYVVEQANNGTFNKGLIMNIGYSEAIKDQDWDCIIFHDVDMIPQHDNNLYECWPQPRHLSPSLDEMRYTLMYSELVGGVLALRRDQLEKINGYSNMYWGWGGEDDDVGRRMNALGYRISRPPFYVGRYKMVRHNKRQPWRDRRKVLAAWQRWPKDGINSLKDLKYHILDRKKHKLYTNISVDVGRPPDDLLASLSLV